MAIKPIKRILYISLGILFLLLLFYSFFGWMADFPKWVDPLVGRILNIGCGVIILYRAYEIRSNRKFNLITLILGILLIVISFINFKDHLDIIFFTTLAFLLLTDRTFNQIIDKQEENQIS